MADGGIQTPNLPRVTTSSEVLVNGGTGTSRQTVLDLATQLVSSDPMRLATMVSHLYDTEADLPAVTAQVTPWVIADPDPSKIGIYKVSAGAWVWALPLPYSIIPATIGEGDAVNVRQLITALPVVDGTAIIIPVVGTNTASPVVVHINGGDAITLKSNSGSDIDPGGMPAGGRVMAIREGATLRLNNDVVATAVLAAAEAARDAARHYADAAAEADALSGAREQRVLAEQAAATSIDRANVASAAASEAQIRAVQSDDAADRAETAAAASQVTGQVYGTEAAGRAAVANGVQFQALSLDGRTVDKWQRVDANSSTLIASIPAIGAVTDGLPNGLVYNASSGAMLPGSSVTFFSLEVDAAGRPISYRDTEQADWFYDVEGRLHALNVNPEIRSPGGVYVPGFSGSVASVEYDQYGRVLYLVDTAGHFWVVGSTGAFEKVQLAGDSIVQARPDGLVVPGMPVGVSDCTIYADGRVSDVLGVDGRRYLVTNAGRWEAVTGADESGDFDIIVYGSGLGGLMSLGRAALRGKRVCVLEPYTNFGGMHAAGLVYIDTPDASASFSTNILGGLVKSLYFAKIAAIEGTAYTYKPQAKTCEKVAQDIIATYAARAIRNVQINGPRDLIMGFDMQGRPKILSIVTDRGIFRAKTFIDASYEMDLAAAALGPSGYSVGRESAATYGESTAGYRTPEVITNMGAGFTGYTGAGSPAAIGYPFDLPDPGQSVGDGDHRVQAMNTRMPLTRDPANRRPFFKPHGYDKNDFLPYLQYMKNKGYKTFCRGDAGTGYPNDWGYQGVTAGNKLNWNAADLVNRSFDYPNANWAERRRTAEEHMYWQQGLFWCVQNDPVTRDYGLAELQDDALDAANGGLNKIGLCEDEFEGSQFGHGWPFWMYVREARRLKAIYIMKEADVKGSGASIVKEHSIGKWSYYMDIHAIQAFIPSGYTNRVMFEGGNYSATPTPVYQIPMESILPPDTGCVNLIVPVCAGYSHVAWAPARLEIPEGFCGEAAGEMAAWQVDNPNTPVQSMPYATLAAALLQGQSKL